jgi:hypothetical protein
MSDAIENEMHSAPRELTQIAANYVGSSPTKGGSFLEEE